MIEETKETRESRDKSFDNNENDQLSRSGVKARYSKRFI